MSTARASSLQIERVEALSPERFARDYVAGNRPVIITGVASQWPAISRWTPDYLRSVGGDAVIQARFDERADFHRYYESSKNPTRAMTFAQLLDRLLAEPPDCRYYLCEHHVRRVSERLCADYDLSAYVTRTNPKFFIGRGVYSCNHYHGDSDSILVPIVGRKKVTLFAPDQWRLLYAYPWYKQQLNLSRVDVRDPDLARYPRYAQTTPIEVVLEPGEMLFNPVHWWHAVETPEFSVAISAFFDADRKCYTFPSPGIQLWAHAWFAPVSVRARCRRWRDRLLGRGAEAARA